MVLDNAAAGQEPPFSESLPTSDIDPYASSSDTTAPETRSVIRVTPPGAAAVYVNLDNLPRRWSLLTTKPHHLMIYKGITESCRYAQEILGRPVKQDEADALAYHFAKSIRIGSYGTPIGVTLATVQCVRTQETFRFPGGFSPLKSERFSPDRLGPLKDQAARAGWQMMRLGAYWGVGAVAGGMCFAIYAVSSAAAARQFDPRLKDFADAMKKRMENRQQLPGGRQADQSDGPRKDETMEMARQRRAAQGAWARQRQEQGVGQSGGGAGGGGDDMSPTGGAFQEEFVQSGSDTGLMDDQQMRSQEYQQRADPRASPAQNNENTYDYKRMTTQTRSADQPGQSSPRPQESTPKQEGGGSAWDRIRQGAMSGGSRSSTGSQQQARADSGDSFTFSQGEEDKQLARSEAQRDFDARLERERNGESFETPSNRNRRL